MNRCQHRESSTSRRLGKNGPLIVAVVSFAAGAAIGMWKKPQQVDGILSVTDKSQPEEEKTQAYDGAHVRACVAANGVLVVRVLNPNGLECTPADALRPVGPEVSPYR
jgi:hypothetical protein